jgi:hypothetical protein
MGKSQKSKTIVKKKLKPQLMVLYPNPRNFFDAPAVYYGRDGQRNGNYYFIVCTVVAHHVAGLVASLTSEGGKSYSADPIVQKGNIWYAFFKGLPQPDEGGTRYHLLVGETGCSDGNRASHVDVNITRPAQSPSPKGKGKGGDNPIQYPPTDGTVGNTFVSYGLSGSTSPTTATMSINPSTTYNGTQVNNVPTGFWMYQFTGVPDGEHYTLTVGGVGSNSEITVDGTGVPPQVAPDPPPPPLGP